MDTKPLNIKPHPSALNADTLIITRVADRQWHALDDDCVVGRGYAVQRPDGRLFVGIDAWHDTTFDLLAAAVLGALPAPLYTIADEADGELLACWRRAGFTVRRRECEYAVPTDPRVTGLDDVPPPAGVTIVPAGQADERLLRAVDRAIRDEVEASVGWQSMPAEVIARKVGDSGDAGRTGDACGTGNPDGVGDTRDTIVDPTKYAVAAAPDRYLGLIRVVTRVRPRIGLLAVRADEQRRGIARALLTHSLRTLHDAGFAEAWTEVQESNRAATALFEGVGARRVSSSLELVR